MENKLNFVPMNPGEIREFERETWVNLATFGMAGVTLRFTKNLGTSKYRVQKTNPRKPGEDLKWQDLYEGDSFTEALKGYNQFAARIAKANS